MPGTDIKLNMKLNDFVQDEDQQATIITDENLKPRLVSLVETNQLEFDFDYEGTDPE